MDISIKNKQDNPLYHTYSLPRIRMNTKDKKGKIANTRKEKRKMSSQLVQAQIRANVEAQIDRYASNPKEFFRRIFKGESSVMRLNSIIDPVTKIEIHKPEEIKITIVKAWGKIREVEGHQTPKDRERCIMQRIYNGRISAIN